MAAILRQSTEAIVHVGPFLDSATATIANSAVVLTAVDDAAVLKHNTSAAATRISARTWSAVVSADGFYSLTLTTGDTDTVGPTTVMIRDVSLFLPVFKEFEVVEEAIYDAVYSASAAGFDAAGQVTVGAISANAIASAAVANDAVSKIVASVSAAALSALTQYDPPTDTEMIARTITSAAYVTSGEALARSLPSASMVTSAQVFAQTIATSTHVTSAQVFAQTLASSAYATSTQAVAAKTLAASAITSAVISASAIVQAHFSPDAIASAAISNDAVSKIVASVSAAALSALTQYDPPTSAEVAARTIPSATYATSTQAVAAKTLEASAITSAVISNDAVSKIVASVSAAALSALTQYDPPTSAEVAARTLPATSAYVTSTQVFAQTLATSAYAISTATANIQTRIPTALVSGRMDSSIDGTGMESGAVDAIWAKAMTELGAVPGVTGTTLAALEFLFLLARNKGTQTSTTKTLFDDAGNALFTCTVSDDGTTFIKGEWS